MLNFIQGVLVCLFIVFVVLILSDQAPQDNTEARIYCDMQQIYQDTNGEFGWPDYRSDIECSK